MFRELKRRTTKFLEKFAGRNQPRTEYSPDQSSRWTGRRHSFSNIPTSLPTFQRSYSTAGISSPSFSTMDTLHHNLASSSSFRSFSTKKQKSPSKEPRKPRMWHTEGHEWDKVKKGEKIRALEGYVPVQFLNADWGEKVKLKTIKKHRFWVPLDYTWGQTRQRLSKIKFHDQKIEMWTEKFKIDQFTKEDDVQLLMKDMQELENEEGEETDGRVTIKFRIISS